MGHFSLVPTPLSGEYFCLCLVRCLVIPKKTVIVCYENLQDRHHPKTDIIHDLALGVP